MSVLIPEFAAVATYRNAAGEEKNVMIGDFGSSRKAGTAWSILSWSMGWHLKKADIPGYQTMGLFEQGERFIIVRKGPYLGIVNVPSGSSQQELEDLVRSLQL